MDAHYHKVMNARDQITKEGVQLYFAYSGVLDRKSFEIWREEHSYQFFNLPQGQVGFAQDMDLVFDFPSRWWGGRVAGLSRKPGSQVYGRLFDIAIKDWPVIQHKEGVVTGMSVEVEVDVHVEDKIFKAIAFTTSPQRQSTTGEISRRYLESLVDGARQSGLPENYIASLPSKAV